MSAHDDLDTEIELIAASLLPAENLESSDSRIWPRTIDITSHDSKLALHVVVHEGYPSKERIWIEVKGKNVGRDEAEGWKSWIDEHMKHWNSDEDYPLYQLLTTHLLTLLAPSSPTPPSSPMPSAPSIKSSQPYHVLLTSHHLIAPSKRKDLLALSSSLSLTGFAKVGHPGIIYAIGLEIDLDEWLREVKSWQWLALRVRISPEPVEGEQLSAGRGGESGARGGKGRGDWTEVEKITDALDWLRSRGGGREKLLLDLGMGGTSGK